MQSPSKNYLQSPSKLGHLFLIFDGSCHLKWYSLSWNKQTCTVCRKGAKAFASPKKWLRSLLGSTCYWALWICRPYARTGKTRVGFLPSLIWWVKIESKRYKDTSILKTTSLVLKYKKRIRCGNYELGFCCCEWQWSWPNQKNSTQLTKWWFRSQEDAVSSSTLRVSAPHGASCYGAGLGPHVFYIIFTCIKVIAA